MSPASCGRPRLEEVEGSCILNKKHALENNDVWMDTEGRGSLFTEEPDFLQQLVSA